MAGGGFASKPVQNVSSNQQMPQGGGKGSGIISPILQSRPMFGGSSSYINAVKESLANSYGDSPVSQEVQPSTNDMLKKYTEGTGTSYSSSGVSQEELLKKIEEQKKSLGDLEFTETKTRKVPVYSYYEGASGPPGLAGSTPGVARTTTQLPKGATYTGGGSSGPYRIAGPGYRDSKGTLYQQQGTKNITETFTRPAKEGDKEYDAAQRAIDTLQKTYDLRNKYATGSTGTQGFIGDPLANPGQTGYNNINEIMKRYIG